jgi:hypothetical protein
MNSCKKCCNFCREEASKYYYLFASDGFDGGENVATCQSCLIAQLDNIDSKDQSHYYIPVSSFKEILKTWTMSITNKKD